MAFSVPSAKYAASGELRDEKMAGSAARRYSRHQFGQDAKWTLTTPWATRERTKRSRQIVLPIPTIAVAYCKAIEKLETRARGRGLSMER